MLGVFSLYFKNFLVELNRRQANESAHALARLVTSIASSNIFIDISTCINHIVMYEML